MRVHHVSVRHRPRRLRSAPWQLFQPALPTERLEPDGEAPLEAWLAFAHQDDTRPGADARDLAPMRVGRPVIHGRRAGDR
jgi:hypothetical protein